MLSNLILNTDAYKLSQWNQYPPNTEHIYSYIESRGNSESNIGLNGVLFFGLQAFIKEYLMVPITIHDIQQAEQFTKDHGLPFNRNGWMKLSKYQGKLPIEIKAVPEGTIVNPTGNVLLTIQNTDPEFWWLTSYLETALLRAIWYPTTVATNSWRIKKLIRLYLEKNGDVSSLDFKLHDFGARGVSSFESSVLGGMSHLVNFSGTDTMSGVLGAIKYYKAKIGNFSIPAMEHSTVTSWGKENEEDSYRNMLNNYAKSGTLVACVSDSWDIYAACEMWGTKLKQQVIDSKATIIIRPDSGDPATVVLKCVQILDNHYGHIINNKNYKVLNNVRVIQGDGINHHSIEKILSTLDQNGYSSDNVAFGMGGALLQHLNRDTLKFAMKCSAICVSGEWKDVYKQPVGDFMKRSKKGKLKLVQVKDGSYTTLKDDGVEDIPELKNKLETIFLDGDLIKDITFDQVRKNSEKY